jgi:hypothetical protein
MFLNRLIILFDISMTTSNQRERDPPVHKCTHFIGNRAQVEEWAKWDELFERGFRVNFDTKWLAWESLFWIHNETVNIWTHLLAIIYFTATLVYTWSNTQSNNSVARWPLFI